MKCEKCNWDGSQHELICNEIDCKLFDINSWTLCPKCKNNLFPSNPSNIFFTSSLLLNTNLQKTAVEIQNKYDLTLKPTIISLERILNFSAKSNTLLINGYKKYGHLQYWINIPTSFINESHILIKILHILHIQKYECQSKQINDHMCFGKFIVSLEDYTSFYKKCSFCARFYEWENQKFNGWPLSQPLSQEILKNKSKNNKFSKIFDIKTNNKICLCNEVTMLPNQKCYYHSTFLHK